MCSSHEAGGSAARDRHGIEEDGEELQLAGSPLELFCFPINFDKKHSTNAVNKAEVTKAHGQNWFHANI